MASGVEWCCSKGEKHGFITNWNMIGTKNGGKSELGVYQSPPVRIAQLFFGGPAAAARLNPSRSPLGAAVDLEQHKSESLN